MKTKEEIAAYYRDYRRNNPDRVRKWNADKRARGVAKKSSSEWYYSNRERALKIQKEWRNSHAEMLREQGRNRSRQPQSRVKTKATKVLIRAISPKRGNRKRVTSVRSIVGCDLEVLKQWIESQFYDGMTWENRGYRGWHVDHIKPCCEFNLLDPEELRKCFHYTNLQPLWAEDNFSKGYKIL